MSASLNLVFWKSHTVPSKALRSFTYSSVCSSRRSSLAALYTAMIRRSCASSCIRQTKPLFSSPSRLSTGTRTLSKNSSVVSAAGWPTLSSLRPRRNPARSASTMIRLTPLLPALGSVLQATSTMSQFRPLLMKVLLPLMTYSSPSRTALVRIDFRSEPVPGSVMAMAMMVSPRQILGSQRCFCSSVPKRTMYGAVMSECTDRLKPETPERCSSSASTQEWPKSPPPPPYSVGTVTHNSPSRPALSQVSRSVRPAASQAAWRGRHSRSKNRRAVSRSISWSSRYTVRWMFTGSPCLAAILGAAPP
ncbi:hypothetical protein D9M72_442070 [compost metagenome]